MNSKNYDNPNTVSTSDLEEVFSNITRQNNSIYSSKALRRYFFLKYHKNHSNKLHNDLADIFGVIVGVGYYSELDSEGYIHHLYAQHITNVLCVPKKRVQQLILILCDEGLLERKMNTGMACSYKVNAGVFNRILLNTPRKV